MKITLVNPPSLHLKYEPPLGLASLGAYLLRHNIDVKIIDAEALGLSHDQIQDELKRQAPDFVGVSVFTFNRFSAFKVAEIAKSLGAKVVVGGPHVSFTPRETLAELAFIDFVVIGEGELSLHNLLKAHQENTPLGQVDGIAFRGKSAITVNKPQALIENLDDLPDPAWQLLPMEEYPFHAVMGARGCPNTCIFCASPFLWNKRLRFLSADRFLNQMKQVLKDYGKKRVHFKDDTFTCHIKRAKYICEQIVKDDLNITWDCLARVHPIDEDLLRLAQKAGCDKIRFGIEAGNEQIMKNIKKNITKEQVRHAVNTAKKLKFKSIGTLFMLGHPGETMRELEETYQLCLELRVDHISFAPAMIFPGTELYEIAKINKMLPSNFSWNKTGYFQSGFDHITIDDVPLYSTKILPGRLLEQTSKRFYARSFFARAFDYNSVYDYRYLFETGLGVAFDAEENKGIISETFKNALKNQPSIAKKLWGFICLALYILKAPKVQRRHFFAFIGEVCKNGIKK
ncbi:MAG: radical SAM protein [Candidatus Schekmanbacteria bacterium]|nr:radical SAM protein [Candidatus Schekmanbacteria bacterium]